METTVTQREKIYLIHEVNEDSEKGFIRYSIHPNPDNDEYSRVVTRRSNAALFLKLWKCWKGITLENLLSDSQLISKCYPALNKIDNLKYELNCNLLESGFNNDIILESCKELSKRGYIIQLSIK